MRGVANSASNSFALPFPISVGREQSFVVAAAVVNAKNLDGSFGDCERDGYATPEADAELATIADIEQASQDSGNWQNLTLIE